MTYDVTIGERTVAIDVRPHREGGWWIAVDGAAPRLVRGEQVSPAEWLLSDATGSRCVAVHVAGDRFDAQVDGRAVQGTVIDPRKAALVFGAGAAAGIVQTQMPGAVVRVLVAVGDTVQAGDPVVVVEAMKMENEFKSPLDGVVEAVHVEAGQAVDAGTALVTIGEAS